MFGRRDNDGPQTPGTQPRAPAQPAAPSPAQARPAPPPAPAAKPAAPKPAAPKPAAPVAAAPKPAVQPRRPQERSADYYRVKTTIFNALIDTIDLTQLAQLDAASAREEIRDIVNEIISIKSVVMSISE